MDERSQQEAGGRRDEGASGFHNVFAGRPSPPLCLPAVMSPLGVLYGRTSDYAERDSTLLASVSAVRLQL